MTAKCKAWPPTTSCRRCGAPVDPVCGPAGVRCHAGCLTQVIPAGMCIGRDGAGITIVGCSLCGPKPYPTGRPW